VKASDLIKVLQAAIEEYGDGPAHLDSDTLTRGEEIERVVAEVPHVQIGRLSPSFELRAKPRRA
jgi:hypothetical protein